MVLYFCSKVVKKSKKSQKEILKDGKLFGGILRDSLSIDKKHACPDSVSWMRDIIYLISYCLIPSSGRVCL